MIVVNADDLGWRGAVSLERHPEGIQPWRLPVEDVALFHPDLVTTAAAPSGVRSVIANTTLHAGHSHHVIAYAIENASSELCWG